MSRARRSIVIVDRFRSVEKSFIRSVFRSAFVVLSCVFFVPNVYVLRKIDSVLKRKKLELFDSFEGRILLIQSSIPDYSDSFFSNFFVPMIVIVSL